MVSATSACAGALRAHRRLNRNILASVVEPVQLARPSSAQHHGEVGSRATPGFLAARRGKHLRIRTEPPQRSDGRSVPIFCCKSILELSAQASAEIDSDYGPKANAMIPHKAGGTG
jgi:hypothetical protein